MSTITTTKDGTEIDCKDWCEGPVATFSHGWPLNADAWGRQVLVPVRQKQPGPPSEVHRA